MARRFSEGHSSQQHVPYVLPLSSPPPFLVSCSFLLLRLLPRTAGADLGVHCAAMSQWLARGPLICWWYCCHFTRRAFINQCQTELGSELLLGFKINKVIWAEASLFWGCGQCPLLECRAFKENILFVYFVMSFQPHFVFFCERQNGMLSRMPDSLTSIKGK